MKIKWYNSNEKLVHRKQKNLVEYDTSGVVDEVHALLINSNL
jgi:hypothetical protein